MLSEVAERGCSYSFEFFIDPNIAVHLFVGIQTVEPIVVGQIFEASLLVKRNQLKNFSPIPASHVEDVS